MAIYGIGCVIDDVDVGDDFYRRGMACIGWMPESKPYLFGTIKEIDIGDIIVIKSFFQREGKQVLRIKGIGLVFDNTIAQVRESWHCIKVRWLRYEPDGIIEVEFQNESFDAGVQRRTTIYREYNLNVCQQIVRLVIPGEPEE